MSIRPFLLETREVIVPGEFMDSTKLDFLLKDKPKPCPDVSLTLASCSSIVEISNSTVSTSDHSAEEEEHGASTSDSSSSPPQSAVLDRMGSGISSSVLSGSGDSRNKNTKSAPTQAIQRTEPGKLPSSHYKGVVPQPNGRWGAQIYEKHQRVWLGTFNGEEEAAKAYDMAAFRFRGRDAITNFTPLDEHHPEALFLRSHSKPEIVDMLRKHTFHDELYQSIHKSGYGNGNGNGDSSIVGSSPARRPGILPREYMFEKTVTPSDVGKLNRLVIPKQHAEKYFPLDVGSGGKGVLMSFEDSTEKTWRFRYSYWNSSQSYVLTKGWSRYVKEKRLQAGDTVTFERCIAGAGYLFIGFRRRPSIAPPNSSAASGIFLAREVMGTFPGFRQWIPRGFCSPPAAIGVAHGSNPGVPSCSSNDLGESSPSVKSSVIDGKCFPVGVKSLNSSVDFVELGRGNSSSGVFLFGASLGGGSKPSTLNLFPSGVDEEEQWRNCESGGKRKGAEELPFALQVEKKQCPGVW